MCTYLGCFSSFMFVYYAMLTSLGTSVGTLVSHESPMLLKTRTHIDDMPFEVHRMCTDTSVPSGVPSNVSVAKSSYVCVSLYMLFALCDDLYGYIA